MYLLLFCRKRLMEDEIHLEKKEQIREKYNEKRLERKSKHDEIRKKYGQSFTGQLLKFTRMLYLNVCEFFSLSHIFLGLKTDDDDEEGS